MKRLVAAAATAILIAGLLPAVALAKPYSGVQDQANDTHVGGYNNVGLVVAQTFTAGRTGNLNRIDLYLLAASPISTSISLTTPDLNTPLTWSDESAIGTSSGWVSFYFSYPVPVVAGSRYGIVLDLPSIASIGSSGDTYAGGEASEWSGSAWGTPGMGAVKDFTFRTWVDPQTTTLAWDKSQVTAGVSTSLQLTETVVFPWWNGAVPMVVRPNAGDGVTWAIDAISLPSWFTPTQIACSAHILPADCTIPNATGTGIVPVDTASGPVTITLTGTVNPASVGNVSASVKGCATYVSGFGEVCVTGTAGIQVVSAAPAPTPTPRVTLPPTSATQSPDRHDGGAPILLVVLLALAAVGSVTTLAVRRR